MKFTKRGAKVGVMVRWWALGKLHYGIITRVRDETLQLRPLYYVRECDSIAKQWQLQIGQFTIHKA